MQINVRIDLSGASVKIDDSLAADSDVDLECIQDDDDRIEAGTQALNYILGGETEIGDLVAKLIADAGGDPGEVVDVELEDVTFESDEEIEIEGDE